MFDVGFSELILLGIVALVVLGPEKLPHAARMAGAWLGKIKRTVIDIQAEIEKEVSAAELKQRMNDEIEKLKALSEPVEEEIQAVQNTIHQHIDEASKTVDAAPAYIESLASTPDTTTNATSDEASTSTVNLVKP
ncbi:MAG: twin-arginine translocase subunit TatB [Moraxellaceae bacterium]|nr:twin-arginine translocase subunit TatB [Moraxellaceae bacterium]MBK9185294.1 twin-arginine translocase subunit TatB [Moraxellaceae bacterium]MBL0229327.1 twin-arginine translocase subunit TatB [Moraxellaceae bacterium]MCC6375077.1 twin-arginine translocase subunit TatB [Moraxellaceae bacterium]